MNDFADVFGWDQEFRIVAKLILEIIIAKFELSFKEQIHESFEPHYHKS